MEDIEDVFHITHEVDPTEARTIGAVKRPVGLGPPSGRFAVFTDALEKNKFKTQVARSSSHIVRSLYNIRFHRTLTK